MATDVFDNVRNAPLRELPDWPQLTAALNTVVDRGDLLREGRRLMSRINDPVVIDWIARVDAECGRDSSDSTGEQS